MDDSFDPEAYASGGSSKPKMTLEGLLLGKDKMPTNYKDLANPDMQDLNKDTAGHAVNAVGASFYPEGTLNPVGKAMGYVAEKTGLSGIPDKLMQKAVGMKKYLPGVGDNLMQQGIKGTKAGMAAQVQDKLGQEGNNLTKAVGSIPGKVSSAPVAEQVGQLGSKYTTGSGITPEAVSREAGLVSNTAKDIAGRGDIDPNTALELKRIAGRVGYKQGEPMSKLASQIAQTEGRGYGQQLERAYANANPGQPNAVADANSKLAALLKANKPLSTPDTTGIVGPSLMDAGAAAVGGALGGPGGAVGSVIARRAAKSPLVQSYGAHGLAGAGRAASEATNRLSPLKALLGQPQVEGSTQTDTFDPEAYIK